nr:unnamed protein product [Digitaria exilis]
MDMSLSASSPPQSVAAPEPCQWSGAGIGSAACGLAGRVLCAVATCVFAAVGSLVGAVTGSMIGMATESGVLRGAGIGAISGAVFTIEVAEASRDLWYSADSGVWTLLYMMSAISSPFAETTSDLFETGGGSSRRGLPADALRRLPEMEIAADTAVDAAGEALCCSVCLQDFRVGEQARRLPGCRHVFHVPCIDSWLVRHGSCPLCRRDI